jgi:hypothetical protein
MWHSVKYVREDDTQILQIFPLPTVFAVYTYLPAETVFVWLHANEFTWLALDLFKEVNQHRNRLNVLEEKVWKVLNLGGSKDIYDDIRFAYAVERRRSTMVK